MPLELHRPYPGVVLLPTSHGSILFGAPADAFKATKAYCQRTSVPFPRILVAPERMIVDQTPQFAPEFFLYDFLFMHGAAFKPELAAERFVIVVDASATDDEKATLRLTLVGPSREEMQGYRDSDGKPSMPAEDIQTLADMSDHLAIKRGGKPLGLDDMIRAVAYDSTGKASLFEGAVTIERDDQAGFVVKDGDESIRIALITGPRVVPFNTLPLPEQPLVPLTFGVQSLGVRGGFDVSGPTTGFLFWVNGRGLIFDGPAGLRYLLDTQGHTLRDVDAIVLSHCHEDHMPSIVQLLLGPNRPKLYTTEPIWRSALYKLANDFEWPEREVAELIDYVRVEPGRAIDFYGASLDFFYTVHPIPTLGLNVHYVDEAKTRHTIGISGDTLHLDGVTKALDAGAISTALATRMREFVPPQPNPNGLYFADVGESLIHGHPKDWADNPNRVVYYHCPDNDHTRGFRHEVATPGKVYPLVPAPPTSELVRHRIAMALAPLAPESDWLDEAVRSTTLRPVAAGELVLDAGTLARPLGGLWVIAAGSLSAADATAVAHGRVLQPGECYGAFEGLDDAGRTTATLRALAPTLLAEIPPGLVEAFLAGQGRALRLANARAARQSLGACAAMSELTVAELWHLALDATLMRVDAGSAILARGESNDDLCVLLRGDVGLSDDARLVEVVHADSTDSFFGEFSALFPGRPRELTARALTDVSILRIPGRALRELTTRHMGLRFVLETALRRRGS